MKFESPLKLKNKVLQLGENEIFGFTYADGFTQRLLSMEMVVDKDYDYEIYFRSADKLTNSKVHYDNRYFEFTLKGHLPVEIEDLVEELVQTKRLSKQLSSPPASDMDDLSEQQYIFKNGAEQVFIDMHDAVDSEDFTSVIEQKFLDLHRALLEWTEKTYTFLSANS